ncbi:glycosyltransferase, group 1 family protein [Leptospira ryugenii]|uniref:Glycosyltransferase, group 1 family protein n=1 Tax=Leptospira ryugenii TaxID=1917863 RepID=A0A2P2E3P4_9LEPT|nr:glycosyltransferase family 4 protein [Leptospira ryugenii]GBF51515.1 glycosyltransferase, group 1 family protein [Leptospira ryugenii]
MKPKIALVVSRYLPNVAGGAEKLAFDYVQILRHKYEIEVFTSCAKDYLTWKNEYPEGTEYFDGYPIHRFKVKKEREIEKMNRILDSLLQDLPKENEAKEKEFIEEQGPFVPSLLENFLKREHEFALVILVGYLYYPIVELLPKLKIRSLIIPTFHEEPVLNLSIFEKVYRSDYFYSFNAPEELLVYQRRFRSTPNYTLIGTFLEETVFQNSTKEKEEIFTVITMGRMEASKGYPELFQSIQSWEKRSDSSQINFVCLGNLYLPKSTVPQVVSLPGYISEKEKIQYIRKADLFVNPSPYESFSIAMMEAWANKIPVLVNGKSEVMRGHCLRSQGGLFYSDETSFHRMLSYFLNNRENAMRMGENGYQYVRLNFSKDIVRAKVFDLVNKLLE